jgi:hypothetical protein
LQHLKFFVQRQLLGKGLAQVIIVVGDQNGADLGHQIFRRRVNARAGR